MAMKRFVYLLLVATVAVMLPMTATAVECQPDYDAAQRNPKKALAQFDEVPQAKKPRIKAFLDDAKQILARAKEDCAAAPSGIDTLAAKAKVLIAQANIAAASLLIKDALVK